MAPRPLCELPGRKDHTAQSQAVPGRGLHVLSPHPKPLLYRDRLPSAAPHLSLLPALPLRPPPPPPQAPLGSRSAPSGSPSRFQRRCSPGPAPRLPPSSPLPSTGSRDGDKGCAAHPTPRPGYFPPPRSRENCVAASGSSRESHHHGSGCCGGIRVLELTPGRGRCGG